MKTPQVPAMPGMSPLGFRGIEKTSATDLNAMSTKLERFAYETRHDVKGLLQRKAAAPLKPKAEQQACNAGLFSDDSKQTEMF
jgi:hypothetical protein